MVVKKPCVSAVITTHNRKNIVKKAIFSVLNQTYENIELIVVDDASEDGTGLELSDMAEKENFKYIFIPKEKSKGGNHARNEGILAASGSYVAFLDDDDEWLPDKIKKQVSFLENNKDMKIIYCGCILDNEEDGKKTNIAATRTGDMSREIFYSLICTTSQIMIDKEFLFEVGLFDESLRYWQEYELLIRVLQKTLIGAVPDCLVLYRVNTSDIKKLSNNVTGWEEAVEYIHKKHRKLYNNLSHDEKKKCVIYTAQDGIGRAAKAKDKKIQRKYLAVIAKTSPTLQNWIKWALNVNGMEELKYKIKNRISGLGSIGDGKRK